MQHKNLSPQDSHSPSQERVENNTGSQIPAFRCVTYSGIGTNYADASIATSTDDIRGVTYVAIADSAVGYIVVYGPLYNVDTSAWTPGTSLYCDTDGSFTDVSVGVQIGNVLKQHATLGVIQVTCLDTPAAGSVSIQDTNSIDLDFTGPNLTADLRLSTDAADANNLKATTTIKSGASKGLHIEYPFATDSVDGVLRAGDHLKLTVQNVVRVKKNPGLGEFSSITAALASITTNSSSNQYLVSVGPGVYVEDTIAMKPYVYVLGSGKEVTVIMVNAPSKDVIRGADFSAISECLLTGATDPGSHAVYHASATGTLNTAFFVNNCKFGENDTLVEAFGDVGVAVVIVDSCSLGGVYQFNNGFLTTNSGTTASRINIRNTATNGMTAPLPTYVVYASGLNTEATVVASQFRTGGTSSGSAFQVDNGGSLRVLSSSLRGFGTAVESLNSGAAPNLTITGILIEGCTADLTVSHPGTTGSIEGSFARTKTTVDSGVTTLSISITDPTGGVTTTGEIFQGTNFARTTNITQIITKQSSSGILSGGDFSYSGYDVIVQEGTGYVHIGSPGDTYVKYVTWIEQTITVDPSEQNILYIDSDGLLNFSNSLVDNIANIFIGEVDTDGVGVLVVQRIGVDATNVGNKVDGYLRDAIGAIYSAGSIVVENATPKKLDVSSGIYYFSTNKYVPSGGTQIQFIPFYKDGIGGFLHDAPTDVLASSDSTWKYDNGSGTLVNIPNNKYVKHSLYIVGDGADERYLLVYGQVFYNTLVEVEPADLPSPPPFFDENIVLIAAIVVKQGDTNVEEIFDQRPVIGFKASGISASADHGNLLGLLDDDHPQYLLVSGTRAMSGNLNMGTHDITNVGLVDGTVVSAHGARHLPTGADPIATAAPTTNIDASTVNATGNANTLARSNHQHGVNTGIAVTLTPDLANAIGTSANLSRSDHVHNIPTGLPVTISNANAVGVAASFAKSDHQHSHGALAGGTTHAAVTTTVNGFMSASDKVKLDGISGARILKAGFVAAGSFTGTPKKSTVTFGTAFPNTNYAIVFTGVDSRDFTYESKLAASFVISANANAALTGEVSWIAIDTGETVE